MLPFRLGLSERLPLLLQTESAECGLACIAMAAVYHGHDLDLASLRRRFASSLKGMTLSRLMQVAGQLGFACRPLKLDIGELGKLKTPCLLHWDLNHFVVLKNAGRRAVTIHDPAVGVRKLSLVEVSEHFTGIALEMTPRPEFAPVRERRKLPLGALTGSINGLTPALVQILVLAFALEIFGLTTPFYLQWVLDQALVSADRSLLTLLGLGFSVITVLTAFLAAARSWVVTWLSAALNVQWATNLFSHLVRLPLGWFEKRHVGDVVSRFSSIESIQKTLSNQFVATLLDGVMSLITLGLMMLYSPRLTALVLAIFLGYGLARWLWFAPLRRATEEQIVFGARQQSELLESIRGALPVKLANKHDERAARYANATVAATNREIAIQRLTIAFSAANQTLFGLGRVALIWLGAVLVLDKAFTGGMLVAFVAYADQFTSRAATLIDKCADLGMLRLHAERVADITLSESEAKPGTGWSGDVPSACLEFRNVSFRYAEGEPWVLRNCNLKIASGESVAVVGPSGCGKSTLAKIALGLLEPNEGEVLFGGINIKQLGLGTYRNWVAAVMQDDQLFAGSIADNISFFDPDASLESILSAATVADIHEEIMKLPMGYENMVGDMGSSLSGGQKQRVILARAFHRQPRLLVLDEATSHLDARSEAAINASVRSLGITRLIIAHRQETIASAHRVVTLSQPSERA
ncbi:peptidase domain-containing ABC transporter [Frateuria sp.]|uniref:peptidase domain-containing ABC transporter n=1 Tax=Frateuria sp. TaxID=2211372 RepID=UPI0031B89E60